MKIKRSNIIPFLATALLFYSLFPIYRWGITIAVNSRTIAVGIGMIFVLMRMNKIAWKDYIWHLLYVGIILISSFVNYPHASIGEIINIIIPGVFVLNLFFIPQILVSMGKEKEFIHWFVLFSLIWGVFVTASVYTQIGIDAGVFNPYFIGNKFNVSYYYIILTCFFDLKKMKNPCRKTRFAWMICWTISLITVILMKCSTAIIMLLVIGMAHVCVSRKNFLLKHIKVVVVALIIFVTLIILKFDDIISSHFISKLLINMGEAETMESRAVIYTYLPDIIKKKMWMGYGYNSNIVAETFAGNAQNALLHIIVQFGIIGAIIFMIMTMSSVKLAIKRTDRDIRPTIYYIIAFILAGIIEITFGFYFYFLLSILITINNKKIERL